MEPGTTDILAIEAIVKWTVKDKFGTAMRGGKLQNDEDYRVLQLILVGIDLERFCEKGVVHKSVGFVH